MHLEHSISTLEELMEAMINDHYQLLVEENSASHANLEVGRKYVPLHNVNTKTLIRQIFTK